MTIQTLFNRMMLGDNQLDLISGGDDVTRGLTALNMAQDMFEAIAASYPGLLQFYSTFTTTAGQEYTTQPADLLRIDGDLWLINGSTSLPEKKITRLQGAGAQSLAVGWPYTQTALSPSQGKPEEYSGGGPSSPIFWTPIPDAVYTIRAYGFWAATDYTAAANTFQYMDSVALIIPTLATKIMRVGLDRDLSAINDQAVDMFKPVIKSLRNHTRNIAPSVQYMDVHET